MRDEESGDEDAGMSGEASDSGGGALQGDDADNDEEWMEGLMAAAMED